MEVVINLAIVHQFGPNKYLRKELLWPYLEELTQKLIQHYQKQENNFGKPK